MGKVLTVSVAAYNMEQYLTKTLDSMVVPGIMDQLEVFIVDDGGKDNSLEIGKKFAAKYPNTFFPIHKENGGYGSTVNYSIAHATGKYFRCLDGDDWFDKDGLRKLVCFLAEADADAVVTPYYMGTEDNLRYRALPGLKENVSIPVSEIINGRFNIYSATFKTELLRRSGVKLPEHMLYTDQVFFTIPFAYAENVNFLNCCVYCYRLGREGQSVNRDSVMKHLGESISLVKQNTEFYEKQKRLGNRNIPYLCSRIAGSYCAAIKMILSCPICKENQTRLREFEEYMKNTSKDIYDQAVKDGKAGKFLSICRVTNYAAYWGLKLLAPVSMHK